VLVCNVEEVEICLPDHYQDSNQDSTTLVLPVLQVLSTGCGVTHAPTQLLRQGCAIAGLHLIMTLPQSSCVCLPRSHCHLLAV
jgi:hypothetical protein